MAVSLGSGTPLWELGIFLQVLDLFRAVEKQSVLILWQREAALWITVFENVENAVAAEICCVRNGHGAYVFLSANDLW